MSQPLMFKLHQNVASRGLRCDGDGLFLGGDALLDHDGEGSFVPRPAVDLRKLFSRIYGDEGDWESRIRSVTLVANALNKGDIARATMTAVLMRLPDPDGPIRITDVDGVLAKAGFNPDEPRDERGRWTSEGDAGAEPGAGSRAPRTQLADVGMSDASDDPVAEAARAATARARNSGIRESANNAVTGARESFWQTLGSQLSHGARSLLAQIGRAEIEESDANLAAGTAEANEIARWLRDYANYRAQPWIGPGGVPVQVPVVGADDPYTGVTALTAYERSNPNAPLTRPATNADWIDALIDLVSASSAAAGPAARLAGPAAEAIDATAAPAAETNLLIGNSSFRSIGEFTDAATAKYQTLYDEGYAKSMDAVARGLLPNDPLIIGNKTDALARVGFRDWLNAEGISEGSGQIVRVNRRLYNPLGSGDYRVPDVYIPDSQTILDGSLQFKTSSMEQVSDYNAFSGGAKVTIIRPRTAPHSRAAGSYGIVQ